MNETLKYAEIIYDYLNVRENVMSADIIIGCGCLDTSIVEECITLNKKLSPKYIIFSGYKGKGTYNKLKTTEAAYFKSLALSKGIPPEKIITEERARTTKQNIKKSLKKVPFSKVVIVHKPYVLKRCSLICNSLNINYQVTSKDLSFKAFLTKVEKDKTMTQDDVLNELVGEIFILKHPKLFGLESLKIDESVLVAYYYLKKKGYNKYCL